MESAQSLGSAENTNNNDYLIEREEVNETPFIVIKSEQGWSGGIGNNRLTEFYDSKEEAITGVTTEFTAEQWQRIIQVTTLLINNANYINNLTVKK